MNIDAFTYQEILDALIIGYKAALGDDINLDASGPIGQLLYLEANNSFEENNSYLAARNACIVNSAQNQDLDNLVGLLNITRSLGIKTLVPNVDVTGTDGNVIPSGSQASDENGKVFESITDITIAGGIGVSDFIAIESGDSEVPIDTLINIVTPIPGWDSVTNPESGITGSNKETDSQLRNRFFRSSQPYAYGIPGAIKAEIMRVPDTNDVVVFENDFDVAGINGQAPHSYWVIVDYPDIRRNDDIAQAIYNRKTVVLDYSDTGIPATAQTGNAQTLSQGLRVMNWNKALRTRVVFEIDLKFDNNITTENVAQVKQSVVDFVQVNAKIGSTLFFSQVLQSVACDAGTSFAVESVRFDRDGGTPVEADLVALYYEIFFTTIDDVNVSFV
jgi:hypothetical protein